MRKFLILAFVLSAFSIGSVNTVYAQDQDEAEFSKFSTSVLLLPNIQHKRKNRREYYEITLPEPSGPFFKEVKFLNQPPAKTISQRVDRLIHGIKIDIPPQYDHYGYEIRRYMKSILVPEDLNDPAKIAEQLKNAKKARVILDYWKKSLHEEMADIEAKLNDGYSTPTLKTTYRYNANIVNSFISDAYFWIDRNIEFLEFLRDNTGGFTVRYPFYNVPDTNTRERFKELHKKREDGLNRVVAYSPFRAMIF